MDKINSFVLENHRHLHENLILNIYFPFILIKTLLKQTIIKNFFVINLFFKKYKEWRDVLTYLRQSYSSNEMNTPFSIFNIVLTSIEWLWMFLIPCEIVILFFFIWNQGRRSFWDKFKNRKKIFYFMLRWFRNYFEQKKLFYSYSKNHQLSKCIRRERMRLISNKVMLWIP